jgi:hypothetical protein
MHVVEPSAAQAVAVPTPPAPAGAAGTASTPFLIMQQQQRDSALSKRQHSGVLGSFFTVSSAFICRFFCANSGRSGQIVWY